MKKSLSLSPHLPYFLPSYNTTLGSQQQLGVEDIVRALPILQSCTRISDFSEEELYEDKGIYKDTKDL